MKVIPRPMIGAAALALLAVPVFHAPAPVDRPPVEVEELQAFAECAAARLGLRVIYPSELLKLRALPHVYLTRQATTCLAQCTQLGRVPGVHDDRWDGTLMIEPLRKSVGFMDYDGEWGDRGCQVGGFLVYGDPELVRQLRDLEP